MSTAITFEDVEQNAERTTAFAVLVKTTTQGIVRAAFTYSLSRTLDSLVKEMTSDWIESLNQEQAKELNSLLQPAHKMLVAICRELPMSSTLGCDRIRERTEDLQNVIESLVLRENADFNNLIAECSRYVGIGI